MQEPTILTFQGTVGKRFSKIYNDFKEAHLLKYSTCSFAFPNMFDVAKNTGAISKDKTSILSRIKLLLLTEPTELYGEPSFGVGLKRYLFRYNSDNIIPEIRDRIVEQLSLWEPAVIAESTQLERSASDVSLSTEPNHLRLTMIVRTIYGDELVIDLSNSTLR